MQISAIRGVTPAMSSPHTFDVRGGWHALLGSFALRHSQYPSLDLRHGAFGRRQVGFEERGEATVPVGAESQAAML